MIAANERPDAGLRRYLGVDPAVEEVMRLAGLERVSEDCRKVNPYIDKKGKNA